jgi:hypothetical protein
LPCSDACVTFSLLSRELTQESRRRAGISGAALERDLPRITGNFQAITDGDAGIREPNLVVAVRVAKDDFVQRHVDFTSTRSQSARFAFLTFARR